MDVIASTIYCEALVWGLGLIMLLFCNIILLLSFCVLYQKMKEIKFIYVCVVYITVLFLQAILILFVFHLKILPALI